MKIAKLHSLLLMAAVAMMVASCSDDGCLENRSAVPRAAFYQGSSAVSVSRLSVVGIGVPGDSNLVTGATASQVELPLRATSGSTSFSLSIDSVGTDTLTLSYTAVPTFVSKECGATYFYDIKGVTVTHNFIDSVTVLTPTITNTAQTNLKIYLQQ